MNIPKKPWETSSHIFPNPNGVASAEEGESRPAPRSATAPSKKAPVASTANPTTVSGHGPTSGSSKSIGRSAAGMARSLMLR